MSDRVNELWAEAAVLPDSPEKVAILEEAVREADLAGNENDSWQSRYYLIRAAENAGFSEKSIVAFSWVLSAFDANSENLSREQVRGIFWRYKWILSNITNYPQVSRSQIIEMQDDMERRYREYGFSPRPACYLQFRNAMRLGNVEQARELLLLWKAMPRDDLADCSACELNAEVEFLSLSRQNEKALKAAEPIVDGSLSCSQVPHVTYQLLVRPAVYLHRLEEAARVAEKGMKLTSKSRKYINGIAEYIWFYAFNGNLRKGVNAVEKYFRWAWDTADLDARYDFYGSASVLLDRIARERKSDTLKTHLPEYFPGYQATGTYETAALQQWFASETESLADRFNTRNGNDFFTQQWQEKRDLVSRQSDR